MKNASLKEIINKEPDKFDIYMEIGGIKYEVRGFSVENNEIILKNA